MKLPTKRCGISLVEVLTAISVVGVLLLLCLPALNAARDASRRSQCANNLKQLGTALHNFHSAHTCLPSSINPPVQVSSGNLPRPPSISWATLALPYFETQWLYDKYDQTQNWSSDTPASRFITPNAELVGTRLSIFECPSAPAAGQHLDGDPQASPWTPFAAPTDYATVTQVEPPLAALLGTAPGAATNSGIMPQNSRPTFDHASDGLSNTILLVESAGRPQVWRRHGVSVGAPPAQLVNGGGWCRPASDIGLAGSSLDGSVSPGGCPMNCTNGIDVGSQPFPYPAFTDANNVVSGTGEVYSFHPGGSNVLFADGAVKFVRQDVALQIFAALVTRAGGEVAAPDDLQ